MIKKYEDLIIFFLVAIACAIWVASVVMGWTNV